MNCLSVEDKAKLIDLWYDSMPENEAQENVMLHFSAIFSQFAEEKRDLMGLSLRQNIFL